MSTFIDAQYTFIDHPDLTIPLDVTRNYLLSGSSSLPSGIVDNNGTLESKVDNEHLCDDWPDGDENEYCESDVEEGSSSDRLKG